MSIDPETCVLTLYEPMMRLEWDDGTVDEITGGGRPLDVDRLSAGERQLVAIAIVWGLVSAPRSSCPRSSTPPGSSRREQEHLVQNYFPSASSQVILLSTDEEINTGYYQMIKGWCPGSMSCRLIRTRGARSSPTATRSRRSRDG